jgi:hypothetical protein
MRCPVPKFILVAPDGTRRSLPAASNCLVLAAFTSRDAAIAFCQADVPGNWQVRPIGNEELMPEADAVTGGELSLVAIDPRSYDVVSLVAATAQAVAQAQQQGADVVSAEYRAIRDPRTGLLKPEKAET